MFHFYFFFFIPTVEKHKSLQTFVRVVVPKFEIANMSAATAHWTKQFQQLRKFLQGHNEKHILLALDNISGAYQKYKVQRAQNKGYEETWNEL